MNKERKKSIAIVVMAMILAFLAVVAYSTTNELDKIRNELTARDAQIQEMDAQIGLARSSLLEVSELNEKYKDEIDQFPNKLKGIIEAYDLKLLNRDKTIASLKNTASGGRTEVVVERPSAEPGQPDDSRAQKISYKWTDALDRFHLEDPDIFVQDNEKFTYNQYISVKGHVLYGKDGRLQIRRVELQEVTPDGADSSGKTKYKDIPGGKMQVVDSQFEYADPNKKEKNIIDILHPRAIASMSAQIGVPRLEGEFRPGLGVEIVNLGHYIDNANLGANIQVYPDMSDIQGGSLLKTRIGAGIDYTLVPPLLDTNIGLGLSASTPSNNLLNEWYLGVEAIFYVTN